MAEVVEKHVRYSTTVEDLPSAWAFVMRMIDSLGPDPAIEILPTWFLTTDEAGQPATRRFSVTVAGSTEEPPEA